MFIDIHAHAYRIVPPALPGAFPFPSIDELVRHYDRIGVEKAVLMPLGGPECYMQQGNEDMLEAARNYPGRIIPFVAVNPRAVSNAPDAPLGEMMRKYKDLGAKGLGEAIWNIDLDDPYALNFFRHAAESGLPVTIHLATRIGGTYGLHDLPGMPRLRKLLRALPDLKIFAHSQVFWAEIGELNHPDERSGYPTGPVGREGAVPQMLREFPNLYGDLSAGSGCNALKRDPDYAVKFLNEFQDKLMFGLDICRTPDDNTQPLVNFLLELRDSGRISEEVFRKVARENAIRILELE
jgi:hypothetical protein